MTELQLYKFVNDHNIEYHWNKEDELYMFVNVLDISEFNELLGPRFLDEDGLDCVMKHTYFAFEMINICEWFDIDPKNVFNKEEI